MAHFAKTTSTRQLEMTSGPLFINIIKFILPLMATNLLQQFYHAADLMVAGLSAEPDAVGAIGSTSSFLSLINHLFVGFSVGANVVVARCIGAGDKDKISRATHTAICMGVLFGAIGAMLGIALARPVLGAMGYEGNLFTLGVRYAYIYLACLPFMSLTHFLSAVLQAQGNTRTPLYVMTLAGVLNVGMNLFFVLVVGLSVEGVAIATAIANLVSACILWGYLARRGGDCRVCFRKLRIHREQCAEIARVGFPSGIQTSLFSLSNIIIQSSVLQINNAITPAGSAYAPVMRGDTAVGSLETFLFTALSAITVAASTFTAQNVGANKYARVRRAFGYVLAVAVGVGILMSTFGMLAREPLVALYGVRDEGDVLSAIALDVSWKRMLWKWPAFFVYAVMNTCAGTIRGMGKSTLAALITFFGTCVFRIVWIYTVFRHFESLEAIYISYPISWFLTGVCFLITVFAVLRKKLSASSAQAA